MDNTHYISTQVLSLEVLQEIISHNKSLALSDEAIINIQKCRDYLDKKMASHSEPIYGRESAAADPAAHTPPCRSSRPCWCLPSPAR